MRIYLIRHGESEAQIHEEILRSMDDRDVAITQIGQLQAARSAAELKTHLQSNHSTNETTELWISPYKRTQQTAAHFVRRLGMSEKGGLLSDVQTHPALHERRKGVTAGYTNEERAALFPDQDAELERAWETKTFHMAHVEGGENYTQVEARLEAFMPVLKEAEARGVENLIIVGHSISNRLLAKKLLGTSYPDFYQEKSTGNGHIRMLESDNGTWVDHGYIHDRNLPAVCSHLVRQHERSGAASAHGR